MATFGQGVNPQLGAINYSPILQGSVAGAQMAAQGGSMIGQGLANLGQEVGKGIEKYGEQKKKNALRDGFVSSSVKSMVSLSETLRKANDLDGAKEALASAHAIEAEPDLDKRYAMAQNGLQNYATIHQLGQQALGEKQKAEAAAYYNYLVNGQKTDVMDGAMGAPQASEQSIAAANEMLLNRRYKESQIAHQNAATGSVAATAGIATTKRQAAILAGQSLITGQPISKDTEPGLYLAATEELTKAGSQTEALNALRATAAQHNTYVTGQLKSLTDPEIVERNGKKYLVLPKSDGGFDYQKLEETDVQKVQEQATATKEILRRYHAAGADSNARFIAAAALIKLNPQINQFGIAGIDEILKDTKPIETGIPAGATAAPATPISISSISPSTSAPTAQAAQPAGVPSPDFAAAAQQSAENNNPPAYRNGVLVAPQSQLANTPAIQKMGDFGSPPSAQATPSGYSQDTSGYQDARGEQTPMVQPQAQTARPVAPSATLTAGAANVVQSSVADKFAKVMDMSNELYLGGEIAHSVFMNEQVKSTVKAGARLAASKLEFLAKNLTKGVAAKVIPVATKFGSAAMQTIRPAMIVNSADVVIGKYLGGDIPEHGKMRASQAVGEAVALWSESESDKNRDKAVSLLLDKSSMLMKSNMSREQKIAKNGEYLRLMNVINEHQGQKVGAFQKYHDDQVAQFNNQFGR